MGTIRDLGVDGGGILHPQHKNRWAVTFINLGSTNGTTLRVQAITCDRPKLEFEKITLDRYNTRAYVAGKYTWQTISMTFEADLGGGVAAEIQSQLELQQQIIGFGSVPTLPVTPAGQDYKFTIRQDLLSGDSPNFLEQWELSGCYFEQVDYGDLDYAASETVKIVCTVSYDHAVQLVAGTYGGTLAHPGA